MGIGTSIELDEYCWRADELRQAPVMIRFLPLGPLFGPLPPLDWSGIAWMIAGGEGGRPTVLSRSGQILMAAHTLRDPNGWPR